MKNEERYRKFLSRFNETEQRDYPCRSRIHPLRSFSGQVIVKREDELGFGASGSKVRKYRSLIPFLKRSGIEAAIVIGGPNSNNILGLTQFLIEEGIRPVLYLRGSDSVPLEGNHLFIRMLVSEDAIRWVSKEQWADVESMADLEVRRLGETGVHAMVIPEGAVHAASIPGAATLSQDIVRNMDESGIEFGRVFIDAGTGLTAAATLLAFSFFELELPVVLTMVAGDAATFNEMLRLCHGWFQEWLQEDVVLPCAFDLIHPSVGRSFGSVGSGLIDSSLKIASEEGIFADLIYSTKHFETVRGVLDREPCRHPVLVVHSGGGVSLSGFQEKLAGRMKR